MRADLVAALRCPYTREPLRLVDAAVDGGEVVAGRLVAPSGRSYAIVDGLPDFVERSTLSSAEVQAAAEYDRVADRIYDVAVDWQFAAMYEDENAVRESMIDMLGLSAGAHVLEIGCGTGRDSYRIARRLAAGGRLHLQDLSSAMVRVCRRTMSEAAAAARCTCVFDYSISSAAALPFADGVFDAVFHFGGFNQFGDLKRAAAELTRVARPGGRIVFGDEAVAPWLKGTEFDAIVTTNNPLFKADAPLAALPPEARDVVVRWIIGNCFYVIGYSKGEGPPPLNLDLPHEGWRGGTMRTRYFGVLEGVTAEAKAMAKEAAASAGFSVHEWLDRLIRNAARKP